MQNRKYEECIETTKYIFSNQRHKNVDLMSNPFVFLNTYLMRNATINILRKNEIYIQLKREETFSFIFKYFQSSR